MGIDDNIAIGEKTDSQREARRPNDNRKAGELLQAMKRFLKIRRMDPASLRFCKENVACTPLRNPIFKGGKSNHRSVTIALQKSSSGLDAALTSV